jgi:hypothetical protein
MSFLRLLRYVLNAAGMHNSDRSRLLLDSTKKESPNCGCI